MKHAKTRAPQTLSRAPAAQRKALTAGLDAASAMGSSPRLAAQRQVLQAVFGAVLQRAAPEEELLQGKFAVAQRVSPEEELPMQGKFATAQLAALEEEEPLQGRFGARPLQRRDEAAPANHTGMPDALKSGVESMSGMDMSDVRVHTNSAQPRALGALAYAQGNDIHLGPGQEQHLPHEAWHVVQQRQGRVAATMQMAGVAVNDDASLEHEADVMGTQALSAAPTGRRS